MEIINSNNSNTEMRCMANKILFNYKMQLVITNIFLVNLPVVLVVKLQLVGSLGKPSLYEKRS